MSNCTERTAFPTSTCLFSEGTIGYELFTARRSNFPQQLSKPVFPPDVHWLVINVRSSLLLFNENVFPMAVSGTKETFSFALEGRLFLDAELLSLGNFSIALRH